MYDLSVSTSTKFSHPEDGVDTFLQNSELILHTAVFAKIC